MNIQDIMLRDIADEERKRDKRDAANMGDECGFPWLAVAVWLAVALAALGAAFTGGMAYQSHRALKADRDFAAWNERVEREAAEAALGSPRSSAPAKRPPRPRGFPVSSGTTRPCWPRSSSSSASPRFSRPAAGGPPSAPCWVTCSSAPRGSRPTQSKSCFSRAFPPCRISARCPRSWSSWRTTGCVPTISPA